jgi:hypothetical protein
MKSSVSDIWFVINNPPHLPKFPSYKEAYKEVILFHKILGDYQVQGVHKKLLRNMRDHLDQRRHRLMKMVEMRWVTLRGNWLLDWMDVKMLGMELIVLDGTCLCVLVSV